MSLPSIPGAKESAWVWYTRRSMVPVVAASVELGELLLVRHRDRSAAATCFRRAVDSSLPIFQALGLLGLARCAASSPERDDLASKALATAERIGAGLVAGAAGVLLGDRDAELEIFFC